MSLLTKSQREEVRDRIKTAREALAFIPPDKRPERLELVLALLKEVERDL